MGKLLFWLLIGLVIYALWRGAKRRDQRRNEDQRASALAVEQMVRCEVCQVNLPRSEAILSHGRFYCCEQHRAESQ